MDQETVDAKKHVDGIFRRTYPDGVYCPNQPIYGFRKDGPRGFTINYIRTYQIIKALQALSFESVLDVGGGEGYTANVMQELLRPNRVVSADLSEEGCKRAREIFKLEATPIDARKLPFKTDEFDVVISSETLEHIPDFMTAVKELARVAKKAIVITVPKESQKQVAMSIAQGVPGDHCNVFTQDSFDFLSDQWTVKVKPMLSNFLNIPGVLADASPRTYDQFHERAGYSQLHIKAYNAFVPVLRRITSKSTVSKLVQMDEYISKVDPWHRGFLFLITKKGVHLQSPTHFINPMDVINVTVPFYLLKERKFVKERCLD